MRYGSLLILNYFKSIFDSKANSIPAVISIIAIAISIFSLILVLSVMKGFDVKVKQKIIASFPHIIIKTNKEYDFSRFNEIKSFNKTFESYLGIILNKKFDIVQIKGVKDFNSIKKVSSKLDLNKFNESKDHLPVVVERNFSHKYNKTIGDKFELLIPDFTHRKPKIKTIKGYIVGVSDISDVNTNRLYTTNKYAKDFIGHNTSFIEIVLTDPFRSKIVSNLIIKEFKELKFKVIDWQSVNFSLFNLMKLERISLAIFLSFLIVISATTIYSNMISLITQKKNEIGTLILLGSKKNSLIMVFTEIGFFVGLIGVIIGTFFATIVILLITKTNIINNLSIDLSFYGIDGFPIVFSATYYFYIILFSILIIIISSLLPSYFLLKKDVESLIRRDY